MKTKRIAFLVAGAFLSIPFAAATTTPTTKAVTLPKQVTIYPNGARVVREGKVELKEGTHSVLFTDIPASIVESSLRLSVEGPKGTRFYGVAMKKEFTPKIVDARTRKLREKLQVLQDEKTDLHDKMEARRAEMNILRTYGQTPKPVGNKKTKEVSAVDFTQSAATIAKRIAALTADNRKDERKVREIDLKINALNGELAQGSSSAREKRTAQADLELKTAGTVQFKLTYQVSGASWTPVYDLNLDSQGEKPKLELGFNGTIRQSTGEDWKGVTLLLSTARPSENTQVPDPTNWWLSYYTVQTQLYRSRSGMPSAAPEVAARDVEVGKKFMKGKAEELEPAELELAKTVQAAFTVTYSINIPKDIPSDGSDHRVGIVQSPHDVELSLVVVPKLSLATFIDAKVTYGGDQILLPGNAQLFRDGEFVGTASLAAKAPGETFNLGFGQDDLVRTERKKGDTKSSPGDRRYQWTTTVSNFHPSARAIEVREQLPRTQQKEIKIEAMDISPDPLPENPERPGLYSWKLNLKPKEKASIVFSYRVRHPEKVDVSGLE
ncbi:MAG: mucoidy inhibitor MuiA family protein [Bdellovibrionales bacterium]|nr:mucoidy inhibitor MuiA family protein [Bdellovibrionales bacterium]